MRLSSTIAIILFALSINAQGVIGGGGICQVDADPNTIPELQVRDEKGDCMNAHNYLTGDKWKFDDSKPENSKWVLEPNNGGGVDGVLSTISDNTAGNQQRGLGRSNGLTTLNLNIQDADHDSSNEIQIISKTGSTVTLSNGGGTFTDQFEADTDTQLTEAQVDAYVNDNGYLTAEDNLYVKNGTVTGNRTVTMNGQYIRFLTGNTGLGGIGINGTSHNSSIYRDFYVNGTADIRSVGNNTFIGYQSGINRITAASNVALGFQAQSLNEDGSNNVSIGFRSLQKCLDCDFNVSIGNSSMGNVVVPSLRNTVLGYAAFGGNVSEGNNNTIVGYNTATNLKGNDNTILGYAAGLNLIGDNNVIIGKSVGTNRNWTNKLAIHNTNTSTPLVYGDFISQRLKINRDLEVDRFIYDSNELAGTNGQVLGRDNGGVIWQDASTVPAGGASGQILSTDGNNNLSWVDDQTGGGGTSDGVVNSTSGIAGDPTRDLNRTIGTAVTINIEDGDSDDQNEIETWSTLAGIPSDILDGDDVDDADADPTNEIETWSTLAGIPTDISDGDDDTQLTESQVDAFANNNGYLTSELHLTGVTNTALNANRNLNMSDGTFHSLNIMDEDHDDQNEIELPAGGNNGQILSTDGIGNYSWVDDQSGSGDGVVQFIANNNAGTSTRALQRSNGLSTLSMNVEDGDSDDTNEIETWSTLAGIPSDIADGDDNTQLSESQVDNFVANNGYLSTEVDGSVTNEIELPAGGSNGDILETDGNGNYSWVAPSTSDDDGIYDGSGTVPTNTVITLTDRIEINGDAVEIIDSGNNSFLGKNSGTALTTGTGNTAISIDAGKSLTNGFNNTFIGPEAGMNTTFGDNNTFIGVGAGKMNVAGNNNVFIGKDASFNSATGQSNKLVIDGNGFPALFTGDFNQEWIKIDGDLEITGHIEDATGSQGVDGQVIGRTSTGIEWQDAFVIPPGGSNNQILATDGTGTVGGLFWTDDMTGGGANADGVVTGFTSNTAGNPTRGVQRSVGSTITLNVEDGDSDDTNEIETWSTLAGIPTDFTDGVDDVDDADSDPTNELDGNGIYAGDGTVPTNTVTNFTDWKMVDGNTEYELHNGRLNIDNTSTSENFSIGFVGAMSHISSDRVIRLTAENAPTANIDIELDGIRLYQKLYDSGGNEGLEGQVLQANTNGGLEWVDKSKPSYGGMMMNSGSVSFNTGNTNEFNVNWTNSGNPENNATEDLVNDLITVEEAGIYMATATMTLDGEDGAKMIFKMYRDGSYQGDFDYVQHGTQAQTVSWTQIIRVSSAPDDIEIRYEQDTATAPNVTTMLNTSRFEVVKISDL